MAEDHRAITTYRYLRVTMVALVLLLAASVVRQLIAEDRLRPSISDYYYTPARAVFVSVLVAIGVCLLALRGNTDWEDTFLNLAGLLAPVVAFVPTPAVRTCTDGIGVGDGTAADIANNVFALLAAGLAGLLGGVVIIRRAGRRLAVNQPTGFGLVSAAGLWAAAAAWFALGRESFSCYAHYTAAITMFVFFILVVAWNAWGVAGESVTVAPRTRYGLLAVAMVLAAGVLGVATWRGLPNGIFWLEASLITLFAAFWVIQSVELWSDGMRRKTLAPGAPEPDSVQRTGTGSGAR